MPRQETDYADEVSPYPVFHVFTCPVHGIDGFIRNICVSKEEIQMQHNEMGGVGVQHVTWDEDFFEKALGQEGYMVSDGFLWVKKDIWSVMEDFSKDPGGQDLTKLKSQYSMFVDTLGSTQVFQYVYHMRLWMTVSIVTDNIVYVVSF